MTTFCMSARGRRVSALVLAGATTLVLAAGCGRKETKTDTAPAIPATSAAVDTLPRVIPGTEPMPASENLEFLKSLADTAPSTHLNLGDYYLKRGDRAEAIREYLRAVELNPKYAVAWNNLGLAYQRSGDSLAAERSFKEAVSAQSDFAKAYSNLGTLALRRGRNEEGVRWLEQAVRSDSNDAIACSNLGHGYRRVNRINDALRMYFRALAVDPSRAVDHFHIGNIYFDKMLWDDAYDRYRMALELDPNIPEARELMTSLEESGALVRNKPRAP